MAAAASLATVLSWTAARGSHHASMTHLNLRSVVRLWQPATAYLLFAAGYIAYITFLSAYLAAHRASITQITFTWALLGLAAVAAPVLWSRPISTWPRATALAAPLAMLSAAAAVALAGAEPAAVTSSSRRHDPDLSAAWTASTRPSSGTLPSMRWPLT